jgi:hypothetical protein
MLKCIVGERNLGLTRSPENDRHFNKHLLFFVKSSKVVLSCESSMLDIRNFNVDIFGPRNGSLRNSESTGGKGVPKITIFKDKVKAGLTYFIGSTS